jgi:hypothetical protein
MCQPTLTTASESKALSNNLPLASSTSSKSASWFWFRNVKVYPLHPLLALSLLPLMPSYFFLNRGFTQWFHWVAVLYLLCQSKFLERFQILAGTSICLGWYSTMVYEYFYHDRFMHALYNNMPPVFTNIMWIMVDDNDNNNNNAGPILDFTSTNSLLIMALSHVLDLLAHPMLTYYFWRKHTSNGNVNGNAAGGTLKQVLSWPVIVSTYLFSRCWSMTHTYYNFQTLEWFYVGYDVYVVNDLDSWYPAYIAETNVFLSVVLWKLCWEETSSSSSEDNEDGSGSSRGSRKQPRKQLSDTTITIDESSSQSSDHKPSLVASESSVSTTSTYSRLLVPKE